MVWRRLALIAVVVGMVAGLTASPALAADSPNRKADKTKILASDKVDGVGAERLNARILAAAKKPLKATGDPIVIGHRVTVGGNYPFQDSVDAVQAMVAYYNDVLGGVGADYEAGKPGRPIEVIPCTAEVAAAGAQSCANELAAKNPLAILNTLNLTQALEYPIFLQAGIPIIEGNGLTPTQMNNANIPIIDAGCLTVTVPMVHAMKDKKYKKVALIQSGNLASSQACYKAYENFPSLFPKTEFKHFPYTTTDPDQLAIAQQVVSFDPDAIIVQSSGTNCGQFWSAWEQLGYDGAVYNASSCQSPALFKPVGDLVKGTIFNFAGDNPEAPNSFFNDHPFSRVEFEMTDKALAAYKPDGVFQQNARQNGNKFMWLAGVLDQMALDGTAITRQNLLSAVAAEAYHMPNSPTPDCGIKVPNFVSICNFANSLWQVKSVDAEGGAKWKLVALNLDPADYWRKLAGVPAATTTTTAAAPQ